VRKELLEVLRCPSCKDVLTLDVYEEVKNDNAEIWAGLLKCGCGQKYAIWRRVPRMLLPEVGMSFEFVKTFKNRLTSDSSKAITISRSEDQFSFSIEWDMYKYSDLTWELGLKERVDYFCYYIDKDKDSLDGLLILDAGCGNGTLSAAIAATGARVVAMDYSDSIEKAEINKKHFLGDNFRQLYYVQGDVKHPPFAENIFDVIYSDGVLHHTKNTKESFNALVPLLKTGGRFFVWLYRSDLVGIYKIKEMSADLIRIFLRPIPLRIVKLLCLIGAIVLNTQLRIRHFLGFKKRRIIPIWLKTLNLFDTFTPKYNHRHSPNEVKQWFIDKGFKNPVERTIPKLSHGGFGMLGIKGNGGNK
jgi:SAM-dependent methyltransferase/uncharacterized protein YbaR (Trm112 family)